MARSKSSTWHQKHTFFASTWRIYSLYIIPVWLYIAAFSWDLARPNFAFCTFYFSFITSRHRIGAAVGSGFKYLYGLVCCSGLELVDRTTRLCDTKNQRSMVEAEQPIALMSLLI